MRDRPSLLFLLLLLCASYGATQTTSSSPSPENQTNTTAEISTTAFSTTGPTNTSEITGTPTNDLTTSTFTVGSPPTTTVTRHNCTMREGTSFTVLSEKYPIYFEIAYNLDTLLNRLSSRFPCVTRQYASVTLDFAETNETVTTKKDYFLQNLNIDYSYESYQRLLACNQSLLYGLKRALEISPAESVILVYTAGSMTDYNDAQLLSDIYTLLEEKKSQVYFLYLTYCPMSASQREILRNISSISYGEFIITPYTYIYSQALKLMESVLSKPLNQSVRILNENRKITDQYSEMFNVTTSLSYLLIVSDERFTLNFTDPNENTILFKQNPFIPSYYYYYYYYDYYYDPYDFVIIKTHLVKSPTAGSWTLNVRGNGLFTVQILGFTGLDILGNCSDSDCHPNATCGEFGGDQQCTCKEGFAGDGSYCDDIDECQDYYYNSCGYYGGSYCVNTFGSYTCNCRGGFQSTTEFGCVDIDECANSSLNDCHPLAVCKNGYGYYTCTCSYGYYGNGRYCEVNECQQGSPCNYNEDCIKYNGSYSCIDPCSNHIELNDPWRSTSNTYQNDSYNRYNCDYGMSGWYQFKGEYGQQIPDHCVPQYSCGTDFPIWMNGSHPTLSDGVVNRTACSNVYDCCTQPFNISVKMCTDGFYVYKLQGTLGCYMAYCTESNISCTDRQCFPDEECRTVAGVSGCYCSPSLNYSTITGSSMPEDINIECGMNQIKVSYSKCQIEQLGFNVSTLHLEDNNCTGATEISDKKYITVITRPRKGQCGAEIVANSSHLTYTNKAYLSLVFSSVTFSKDITCTFPRNMETVLLFSTSVLVSESNLSLGGSLSYTTKMGIFQDSNYTMLYEDPGTQLNTNVPLYIGIRVEGPTPSTAVLLMKSCHVTTTSDSNNTARYKVISDYCPSDNASTLYVEENGVSRQGRFSLKITEFAKNFSKLYIDCQIHLCNTTLGTCSPNCSKTNSVIVDIGTDIVNLTAGPLLITGNLTETTSTLVPLHSSEALTTTTGRSSSTVTQSSSILVTTSRQHLMTDTRTSSGSTQTSKQLGVTWGTIKSTSKQTTAAVKDQTKLYISVNVYTVLSKSEMAQQLLLQINKLIEKFPGCNITAIWQKEK